MATSGSTDWTLNRDQVIKGALRKIGVLVSGGSPTSAQTNDAAEALNGIIKTFQADGMPVWRIISTSFTTVDGTNSYTIGPSQTVNAVKPLRVIQAFRTPTGSSSVQVPLQVENRYDFMQLPQSSTPQEGTPVTLYYQPLRATGTIKLWPAPDNSTTSITIHYQAVFEDMDGASDDFDFPSEWITPLIYNLAWVMAPEYGVPLHDRKMLGDEARYWHEYVLSMGTEEGSIQFQPRKM